MKTRFLALLLLLVLAVTLVACGNKAPQDTTAVTTAEQPVATTTVTTPEVTTSALPDINSGWSGVIVPN